MGYAPLPRSRFKSDDDYRHYLIWACGMSWLGKRWLKKQGIPQVSTPLPRSVPAETPGQEDS